MNKRKKNRNYKYVVLGCGLGEYYEYAYRQLHDLEGVIFENDFPWNRLIWWINRIHFSQKLNSYYNIPYKKCWVRAFFRYIKSKTQKCVGQNEKVCFVFFRTWFIVGLFQNGLSKMLREEYPNCKIVFFIQDQVKVSGIPIEVMQNNSDIMLYYDRNDAIKWNGFQYDVPYSDISEFIARDEVNLSDVYFIGYAKDRFEDIILAYETLTKKGFSCDFNILGVPKEKRLYEDCINYDTVLSYKENLERAGKSRCILEIIQKNSVGNTLRVYEAIMLNKLLLSNNSALRESVCYNSKYMYIFDDMIKVDFDFLKTSHVEYLFKEDLYPENLLLFLEEKLLLSNN